VRYLADHHISPRTVAPLKATGFDIYRVSDVLPPDAEDLQILELARSEGRAVITQDLDYSALLASTGHTQPSVVSLRLHTNRPERLASVLEKIRLFRFFRKDHNIWWHIAMAKMRIRERK